MSLVQNIGLPPIATEIIVNYSKVAPSMEKAGIEIDKGAKKINNKFDNMSKQGHKLSKLGGNLTKYVTVPTIALGGAAVKAAIDYESAFAGVRKTVDATEEEYKTLSDGIRAMSKELPTSAANIAAVTEAAGQLGIKKENLLSFTRTMVDLGESTNLSADQAATQLARFANITGMSQDKFKNLGSTIVDLGNNFATTESDIVDMAMRLAGAGHQVGLTEPQIMGFATALSSVGIEAEMGGSAFSKLMINMGVASEVGDKADKVIKSTGYSLRDLEMMASHNKKGFGQLAESMGYTKEELTKFIKASKTLKGFSEVTGMTGEQFKQAFEKDAVGAIQLFIKGLSEADKSGKSTIGILDDMGIKEVRLRDTILRATGAKDLFTEAVDLGNKAWDENNALTKEAEQRYKTTKSQIEIAKNKIVDLGISFGEKLLPHVIKLIDKGSELVEWFGNLDDGTQETILKMGGLAIAAGPVVGVFGNILKLTSSIPKGLGLLNKGLGLLGIGSKVAAPAVAGVANAATGIGTAAASAGGAAGVGSLVTGLGGAVAAAAPFIAGAAAVAGAGYGIYKTFEQKATPAVDKLKDGLVQAGTKMVEVNGKMVNAADLTFVKISESTKKQMQSYYDLSDGAQKATMEMYAGLIPVTDQNIKEITTKVEGMAKQTVGAINTQRDESIKAYEEMFSKTTTLTAEEKIQVIKDTEIAAKQRTEKVEGMKNRIVELYEEIKEKGIANTSQQKAELDKLYQDMASEQIRSVTQSKNEQELLLNNLKNNSGEITSKMVEDAIKSINKRRDEHVRIAEEEYEKSMKLAAQYKTDMELNSGKMSDSQRKTYEKMVADAEYMRESTIKEYDNLRYNGIKSLITTHGDLTRNIDFETGKQISTWEKLKRGVGEAVYGVESDIDRLNKTRIHDKSATFRIRTINETFNYAYNKMNSRDRDNMVRYGLTASDRAKYGVSHRSSGLDYVPYDGYRAHLHRGERILTADENKKYSNKSSGDININIDKIENNTKEDVRRLVKRIGEEVRRQRIGKGEFA
ncbi:phage tail tape measure protein [Helcococcus kunzii]|uniref:phage tail tape measure protein n=1 Tax=Helcococcus kunzii TaxID=40091 RepID=UPI0038A4D677